VRDAPDLDARVASLRQTLAVVRHDLADLPIRLALHTEQSNPAWQRASAFVGDAWVAKFAWTDTAARALRREIALRRTLADRAAEIPVPAVVAASDDPPLLLSRSVPGQPVTGAAIARVGPADRQRLAGSLADTLAALHQPSVRALVDEAGLTLGPPNPQADTDQLRTRFPALVDERRGEQVRRWADWIDTVLADPVDRPVFLHGDFHGHNLVVGDDHRVRALLDFEESGVGDHHYDFRYLPAQEETLDLFSRVAAEYEQRGGAPVDPRRVLAWHVRTVLGDALWRTEAGVTLPEGGTPTRWVDELARRFVTLGLDC